MRTKAILSLLVLALFAIACGPSGPSEADLQAEAEADRIDSLNQVLENVTEEVSTSADSLAAALEALDELFPEEE